ncbi:TPA: AMP-binding protein [Pseudomonas aeruginosa]
MHATASETLIDRLLHWELTRPDTVFMTQPQAGGACIDYTWHEVGEQARRMAAYLQSLQFPPGSAIAILGKNSAHWIIADLAIWLAGHISVPVYSTANAETVRYVLEHSQARLVFIGKLDELWAVAGPGIPDGLPCVRLPLAAAAPMPAWDEVIANVAPLQQPAARRPGEPATIIYTSGSTGWPKGVLISFGAMVETVRCGGELLKVSADDRLLSYLPLAHAAERALVEAPALYWGMHVYFAYSLDTFMDDLRRARPTVFFSVPRLWTKFHQRICAKLPLRRQQWLFALPGVSGLLRRHLLRQLGLQDTRIALSGSAPLTPVLIHWYRELGLELLECYSMSENFAYSHANVPGDVSVGSVGRPAPGVEQRISDEGEVLVRSPSNMLGYYKDPELTTASFTSDGFLRTGDMGRLDADGRLTITGRVKELFKTAKGKYVVPVPIENKLCQHPKVECICLSGSGQPQPFALLMLSPEAQQALGSGSGSDRGRGRGREAVTRELETLLEQVNATLEAHEHLDYLVVVKDPWTMENGFLTPTMKIKRNVIEKRYLQYADEWLRAGRKVIWE